MWENTKLVTGIDRANCATCAGHYWDNEGNKLPCFHITISYPDKIPSGFPFAEDRVCWTPDFWQSSFADSYVDEDGNEIPEVYTAFHAAIDRAMELDEQEHGKG